jgi:hypothetical protein
MMRDSTPAGHAMLAHAGQVSSGKNHNHKPVIYGTISF